MKEIEAYKTLVRHNIHFQKTFDRLMKWDTRLTIKENAQALSLNIQTAIRFQRIYQVAYAEGTTPMKIRGYQQRRRSYEKHYRSKWDETLTIKENAKACGVGVRQAELAAKIYELPFLRLYKNSFRIIENKYREATKLKIEQIRFLEAKGFNSTQIGKLIGLSRERVRQLGYGAHDVVRPLDKVKR